MGTQELGGGKQPGGRTPNRRAVKSGRALQACRGPGSRSPKSMRSLWLRCSRASSSCLSGADVSLGMLGGARRQHDTPPTQGLRGAGDSQDPGTYVGTSVLFLS